MSLERHAQHTWKLVRSASCHSIIWHLSQYMSIDIKIHNASDFFCTYIPVTTFVLDYRFCNKIPILYKGGKFAPRYQICAQLPIKVPA